MSSRGRSTGRVLWPVLLSLLAVNGLAFFLSGTVDSRLQQEERERLSFLAKTLSLGIARRIPMELSTQRDLRDLGERFDRARRFAGLEAVYLVDREGIVLVEAGAGGVRLRSRVFSEAEAREARAVWSGLEAFEPAAGRGRLEGGRFYYPVFALSGGVEFALTMVTGPDFRARLDRLSPMILLARGIGVFLLCVFLLALVISLRRAVARSGVADGRAGGDSPQGDQDAQFMINTFHEIVTNFKESETELKSLYNRAEERAVYLEKVVAYMLRSLPTGVVIFDREQKVLLMNAAARAILGLPRRDYRGDGPAAVFGAGSEMTGLLGEVLREGRTHARKEIRFTRAGDEATVGLSTSPIYDPSGTLLGAAFLLADLTETKRLRERVALKDRLSAMGEMSAGIAHELRNSLATLLGYCRLLEKADGLDTASRSYVGRIAAETRVLEETSAGLLEFVRPGRRATVSLDVEATIAEALGAVRERNPGAAVLVETSYEARGVRVEGDPTALRKALENLIENAYQAMAAGGALRLATRRAGAERPGAADGGPKAIEITVGDTGPGIGAEALARIFIPFYTTKPKGTGLGLAIVQKTITEHDGAIDVSSRPGEGTEFRIVLPCRPLVGVGAIGSAEVEEG